MIYRCGQICDFVRMAQTVCVLPPAEDRERLLAIVADRNRPLKHVKRADIVLFSAERLSVQEVRGMRASADPRSGAGKRDTPITASKACAFHADGAMPQPRARPGP